MRREAVGCLSPKASVAGTPNSLGVGEGPLLLAARMGILSGGGGLPCGTQSYKLSWGGFQESWSSPVYLPESSEVSCHTQVSVLRAATWGHRLVSH